MARRGEPVWDEQSKWLGEQKPGALPKSPLGDAIGYASNNWAALKRYLEKGFLALDNNRLRPRRPGAGEVPPAEPEHHGTASAGRPPIDRKSVV